ncbi:Myosin light chain kinase, smooth muscle, partial [Orchesella cincta]
MSTETDEMEISIEAPLMQRPASRDYQDPIFIQPLKDLIVNEGDKVVLECKTTGRIKKLMWLKDGLEIVNNPDYKTDFLDGSTAMLTIDEALQEDSAIFTCRAFGEGENVMVETSGRLTIREPVTSLLLPPQFLPHAPVSIGEHGKSHFLQLKVEGNPLPTVMWFKDGQCIDTSPDYIITFNNGLCEIQFDELVKDMDDGVYICVGTNKLGDCETQVELQIRGD